MSRNKGEEKRELWTLEELSSYLKIPKSTIYYYMANGMLPYVQLGRHKRFIPSDIEKALKKLTA